MNHFAIDASALIKRYHNESGTAVVQTLTDALLANEPRRAVISWPVLAETLASLNRKKNAAVISESVYKTVRFRLLLEAREMIVLTTTDVAVRDSLRFIEQHNLNAADALFLRQVLGWQAQLPKDDAIVLVAADRRLLRAAARDGLSVLDPEHSSIPDAILLAD